MESKELSDRIRQLLDGVELEGSQKNQLANALFNLVKEVSSCDFLQVRLNILYEYEKHYLELLREHKEEIKFANSLQEDLRRERSQFFTQILKEVSQTLKGAEVDSKVASQWVEDLVQSYTTSINVSSDAVKTSVVDVFSAIKEEAKKEASKLKEE